MDTHFWCCTPEQFDLSCLILIQIMFRWTKTFSFTDDWGAQALRQIRKSRASKGGAVTVWVRQSACSAQVHPVQTVPGLRAQEGKAVAATQRQLTVGTEKFGPWASDRSWDWSNCEKHSTPWVPHELEVHSPSGPQSPCTMSVLVSSLPIRLLLFRKIK